MTPALRPWMPLHRHRFTLGYTLVPRTAAPFLWDEDGCPRSFAPTAALARRRFGLFRRTPGARELRLRLDRLTAEARACIAELAKKEKDPPHR